MRDMTSLQKDELYLNLVLDFIPETVYRVIRHHSKAKQMMPILYVKVIHSRNTMLFLLETILIFDSTLALHLSDFTRCVYYL